MRAAQAIAVAFAPARNLSRRSKRAVTVVGPNGVVSGFTLPFTTFELHTAAGSGVPSAAIDAWFLMGDASNLSGTSPTMTGTHFQSYTMNTMLFIPGSDVPEAANVVTGHYDYDQATQTTLYASCSGIPGCTLADNGQPYVGNYSGIVNPSGTSGANWTMVVNATTASPPPPPPPPALAMSGTLPSATVGVAYSSTALVASGGVPPYSWSATGLPPGLAIAASTGAVFGTPTTAMTYGMGVTVTDSAGATASTALSMVVNPAPVACAATNAVVSGVNKFWLDIGGGLAGGGQSVVYAPAAATSFTGGTSAFAVGELVDYAGTLDGAGMCAATGMTVKPAPPPIPAYSCTKPAGAKSAQGKNRITGVGAGYIVVGSATVQVPSCATVSWNGAGGFAVGQRAEYEGYRSGDLTVATKITIN